MIKDVLHIMASILIYVVLFDHSNARKTLRIASIMLTKRLVHFRISRNIKSRLPDLPKTTKKRKCFYTFFFDEYKRMAPLGFLRNKAKKHELSKIRILYYEETKWWDFDWITDPSLAVTFCGFNTCKNIPRGKETDNAFLRLAKALVSVKPGPECTYFGEDSALMISSGFSYNSGSLSVDFLCCHIDTDSDQRKFNTTHDIPTSNDACFFNSITRSVSTAILWRFVMETTESEAVQTFQLQLKDILGEQYGNQDKNKDI